MKKYLIMAVALMISMFTLITVHADGDTKPYYSVESVYNSENQTYTAKIYLVTEEFLQNGTFGLQYDASLKDKITFAAKEENITVLNPETLAAFSSDSEEKNYILFTWLMKDITPNTGKILLGEFTVTDVALESDVSSLTQLDWTTTAMYTDEMFTSEEDSDVGLTSLNSEIWRSIGEEEKQTLQQTISAAENAEALTGYYKALKEQQPTAAAEEIKVLPGYYQGYAVDRVVDESQNDYSKYVDIGCIFVTDNTEKTTVSGTVEAFNPNMPVTVTLYRKPVEEGGELTNAGEYVIEGAAFTVLANNKVTGTYSIEVNKPEAPGDYILEIKKDVHLTYKKDITIGSDAANVESEKITLYCGDVKNNGNIKLDDRSVLMKHMNQQLYSNSNETAKRCDLNGDGKITLSDLNIFKLYYNKNYV